MCITSATLVHGQPLTAQKHWRASIRRSTDSVGTGVPTRRKPICSICQAAATERRQAPVLRFGCFGNRYQYSYPAAMWASTVRASPVGRPFAPSVTPVVTGTRAGSRLYSARQSSRVDRYNKSDIIVSGSCVALGRRSGVGGSLTEDSPLHADPTYG